MTFPSPSEFDALKRLESAASGHPAPRMHYSPVSHGIAESHRVDRPAIAIAFMDEDRVQVAAAGLDPMVIELSKLRRTMLEVARRIQVRSEGPRLVMASQPELKRILGYLCPQSPSDQSVAYRWSSWWKERATMPGTGAIVVVPRVMAQRWYLESDTAERDVGAWARAFGVIDMPPAMVLLGLHDRAAAGPCLTPGVVTCDSIAFELATVGSQISQVQSIGVLKNRILQADRWAAALAEDPVYVERARCEGRAVLGMPFERRADSMLLDCGESPVRIKVGYVRIRAMGDVAEAKLEELTFDRGRGIVMSIRSRQPRKGRDSGVPALDAMVLLERAFDAKAPVIVTANSFSGGKIDTNVHMWTSTSRPRPARWSNIPLDVSIAAG